MEFVLESEDNQIHEVMQNEIAPMVVGLGIVQVLQQMEIQQEREQKIWNWNYGGIKVTGNKEL